MYLKKYINFNIFKFNFSISQHVVCLHLFDLFTYLISLHWKIESEIAWLLLLPKIFRRKDITLTRNRVIRICIQNTLVPPIAGYF